MDERRRIHEAHEPDMVHRIGLRILLSPSGLWWVHTLVGGHLVYRFLRHMMSNVLDRMAPVDAACIQEKHPEYPSRIVAQVRTCFARSLHADACIA